MNKNLEMIEEKNNFFSRLICKIKKLFRKTTTNETIEEKQDDIAKESVFGEVKISDKYKEMLKLQKKIENDEISIADITDEEAEKLIALYTEQNV